MDIVLHADLLLNRLGVRPADDDPRPHDDAYSRRLRLSHRLRDVAADAEPHDDVFANARVGVRVPVGGSVRHEISVENHQSDGRRVRDAHNAGVTVPVLRHTFADHVTDRRIHANANDGADADAHGHSHGHGQSHAVRHQHRLDDWGRNRHTVTSLSFVDADGNGVALHVAHAQPVHQCVAVFDVVSLAEPNSNHAGLVVQKQRYSNGNIVRRSNR